MLDAGKLRHRLNILVPTSEQDSDTGEMETTWYSLTTVWGSFEPYSTKERIAAATAQEQTSVRAAIRYRSDIFAEMRILFRSKLYEIVGPPLPDKDSGLEYLTLMLKEIDSGAETSYDPLPSRWFVGDSGVGEDGSWRVEQDGDNLLFQRRESGVWVTKGGFAA